MTTMNKNYYDTIELGYRNTDINLHYFVEQYKNNPHWEYNKYRQIWNMKPSVMKSIYNIPIGITIYGNNPYYDFSLGCNPNTGEVDLPTPPQINLTIQMSQYYDTVFPNNKPFNKEILFKSIDDTLSSLGLFRNRGYYSPIYKQDTTYNEVLHSSWCSTFYVRRLDVYRDISVNDTTEYLDLISGLSYPHMNKIIVNNTTYFKCKGTRNRWELYFYDKTSQLKEKNKDNQITDEQILRMEERLPLSELKRWLDKKKISFSDIYDYTDRNIITNKIKKHLEKLKLIT